MTTTKNKNNIAVFIDADNAPAAHFHQVLAELATHGTVNIRRAYGNWHSENLKQWRDILQEYAIRPMQQFDVTKGKNATDMAMTIDVMDILHSKQIDIICLVSSDSDFTPLVTRCLEDGKQVIGFGERKTPVAFTNSCSTFLYLDTKHSVVSATMPSPQSSESTVPRNYDKQLSKDKKLIALLKRAIDAVEDGTGWASLSAIGSHISNHASFDQRNYGYKKLSDLMAAIDVFEIRVTHGSQYSVRCRP